MFGIGAGEFILILIVGLIVFGPSKLPEVGRSIGKALREFRRAQSALSNALAETEEQIKSTPSKTSTVEKKIAVEKTLDEGAASPPSTATTSFQADSTVEPLASEKKVEQHRLEKKIIVETPTAEKIIPAVEEKSVEDKIVEINFVNGKIIASPADNISNPPPIEPFSPSPAPTQTPVEPKRTTVADLTEMIRSNPITVKPAAQSPSREGVTN